MSEMQTTSKRLSFEWDEKGEVLEIHGNREGLESLIVQIQLLLTKEVSDHVHLMTPEWGGDELTSEPQNAAAKLLNHVKVLRWK